MAVCFDELIDITFLTLASNFVWHTMWLQLLSVKEL